MHLKCFKLVFVAVLLVLAMPVLSACETSTHVAGKPLPMMTFDHLRPVPLRIGMLKTDDGQTQKLITESFVVSPYTALEQYLHSRFKPNGFDGTLQAVIQDASIRHSHEKSPTQVSNFLNVGGVDVYDMSILLKLEHLQKDGGLKYGTVLTVRRLVNVSEHASIADRERAQFEGMEQLFRDLDQEVLRIVLGDMGLGLGR